MLPWSLEHHVFAYDTYVKNGKSVIKTQRLFKRRFNIGRHGIKCGSNKMGPLLIQREGLTLESGFKFVLMKMVIISQT